MGKFKVGDEVQLAYKPLEEYDNRLVVNWVFKSMIEGRKLIIIENEDEDGIYGLRDPDGKRLYLNANDIEAWD